MRTIGMRLLPVAVILLFAAPVAYTQTLYNKDSLTAVAPNASNRDTINGAVSANHPGQKLKLTIRTFDDRKQIFLAAGMMIFLALMMTTAQQFNPN